MSRTPIDPKLIHTPGNFKRDVALHNGLIRLVPRQLAETLLIIMQERCFKAHPPEDVTIPEMSDEEVEDLKDAPREVQGLVKALSGMHIPAPTKQESLKLEPDMVDTVCSHLTNTWVHLLYLADRKKGTPDTIRLTEDLLPEDVPDMDVYDAGVRRKAKSSRETLAYHMGQFFDREETFALYLAFVANLRQRMIRGGKALPLGIVIRRDKDGYYAKRK